MTIFKNKTELLYIIFLLSGILKIFLVHYNIYSSVFDITLLSTLIMSIYIFVELINSKTITYKNDYIKYVFILLGLLFIWILVSVFYSTSADYIYEKIIRYIVVFVGFIYPIIIQDFSKEKFYKLFVIITVIVSIAYLPLFMESYQQYSTNYDVDIVYRSYLAVGYTIALAIIINYFSSLKLSYKFLNFIILLPILMTTGARGPLVFLFLIFMVYYIYNLLFMKSFNKGLIKYISLIGLVGMFLFLTNSNIPVSDVLDRTYSRVSALANISNDESANSRLVFFSFVMDKMDTEHFYQGYGFGSFGQEHIGLDIRHYPHNIFLEIYFELGAIGVFLYSLIISLIFRYLFILKKPFEFMLFSYLFLNSLKSLSFVDSRVMFALFALILLGNLKSSNKIQKKES